MNGGHALLQDGPENGNSVVTAKNHFCLVLTDEGSVQNTTFSDDRRQFYLVCGCRLKPSDSPSTCMLDFGLITFSSRPAANCTMGVDGVSRFPCAEFPCMRGVSDCAESNGCSRLRTRRYCLPPC